MPKQETVSLRKTLSELLRMKGAHLDLETALVDFPAKLRGAKLPGAPHTAWQLLEHMRIALWDIYEFSINQKHQSPEWPKEYWPEKAAPEHEGDWDKSAKAYKDLIQQMSDLVSDEKVDLFARIPHGDGQTILREALLVADHNAYHLGQLVLVRKLLGAWK